jgi:phosphinothricin acetyltransferase
MNITAMLPQHAEQVLQIYQHGIDSGIATFETQLPSWEKFSNKYLPNCRFVSIENNVVTGWATLSAVSPRECYKGVAEVSVYVHRDHWKKGIGKALLQQLITDSEQQGIWSLLSVIDEENAGSIQLHYNCGFRMIGYREKLAQLHGNWKTVVMMERRSKVTGL